MTIFVFVCAGAPAEYAANFACTWNDGTANWTTAVDWSTCNNAFPNNGQPSPTDTYDVTISTGDPTLTTPVTVGSVTINGSGRWDLIGPSGAATLTGGVNNYGNLDLDFFGSQGGSSLTVGGTLTNTSSGIVQVGTSGGSLSATSTVSAAALSDITFDTSVLGNFTEMLVSTSKASTPISTGSSASLP